MSKPIYENPWFIALATIPLTYLVSLALSILVEWIRSQQGRLTGTYLSLTRDKGNGLLAELVQCRHVGHRLHGSIHALCRIPLHEGQVIHLGDEEANYKFSGRIAGPLLSLSYWAPRKAENGGTFTFMSTVMGDMFEGVWSGLNEAQRVGNGKCIWIRVNRREFPKRGDPTKNTAGINAALADAPSRWRTKGNREARPSI